MTSSKPFTECDTPFDLDVIDEYDYLECDVDSLDIDIALGYFEACFKMHQKFHFCEFVLSDRPFVADKVPVIPYIVSSVPNNFESANAYYCDVTKPEAFRANCNSRYDLSFCVIPEGAEDRYNVPEFIKNVEAVSKNVVWLVLDSEEVYYMIKEKSVFVVEELRNDAGTKILLHTCWKKK